MNEFLTENSRRAYPLAHELPASLASFPLWGQLLADACVSVPDELGDRRLALLHVQRLGTSQLRIQIGADGAATPWVTIPRTLHGRFAVVPYTSATLKALLTVNVAAAHAIMDSGAYGTASKSVNVPFDLRCTSGGHPRVTSVSAYSAAMCATPVFTGAETPVKTITSGDVVLAAKEGVDVEATELMPLTGSLLRLSAIAAPADTGATDTDVDLMLRGDGCFTIEAIPGAKVVDGVVTARTESEEDGLGVLGGGVIKIGNVCKPCCQCEDYKAAVDALRGPAADAAAVEQALNTVKQEYDEAVAAFEAAKTAALAAINDAANIRCRAVASLSQAGYTAVTAPGTRARITITVTVENMTLRSAVIGVTGFTVSGYTHQGTTWTSMSNGTVESGTSNPTGKTLASGGTLTVVATYAKANSTVNAATRPSGMSATLTIMPEGQTSSTRTIPVT